MLNKIGNKLDGDQIANSRKIVALNGIVHAM